MLKGVARWGGLWGGDDACGGNDVCVQLYVHSSRQSMNDKTVLQVLSIPFFPLVMM